MDWRQHYYNPDEDAIRDAFVEAERLKQLAVKAKSTRTKAFAMKKPMAEKNKLKLNNLLHLKKIDFLGV